MTYKFNSGDYLLCEGVTFIVMFTPDLCTTYPEGDPAYVCKLENTEPLVLRVIKQKDFESGAYRLLPKTVKHRV